MKLPMKLSILLLSVIPFLSLTAVADDNFGLHFGLSAAFGYVGEDLIHDKVDSDAKRVIYGTALGSILGLAKELTDQEFSEADMAANIAGAFVGSYFALKVNSKLVANIQKQKDGYMLGFVYVD